jgi:hypothetical protein
MDVSRNRRMTCVVNQTVQYTVPDEIITHLMGKDGMTKEEAVEEALSNGHGVVESYDVEIDDIVMVHETNLEID